MRRHPAGPCANARSRNATYAPARHAPPPAALAADPLEPVRSPERSGLDRPPLHVPARGPGPDPATAPPGEPPRLRGPAGLPTPPRARYRGWRGPARGDARVRRAAARPRAGGVPRLRAP